MAQDLTISNLLEQISIIFQDISKTGFPNSADIRSLLKITEDSMKAHAEPANVKLIDKRLKEANVTTLTELGHEKVVSVIKAFRCRIAFDNMRNIAFDIVTKGRFLNPVKKKTLEVKFLLEFRVWFNEFMQELITKSVESMTLETVEIFDREMKRITEGMKKDQ